MPSPETQRVEEQVDIALANLMFSGLSIAQMDKIPKWLLKNMDKNKPKFKETLHTSLVAAVEGLRNDLTRIPKRDPVSRDIAEIENGMLDNTLTIINSIFKE